MTLTLNVFKRQKGEKKDGMIKAVMYGAHFASTPIFVNEIEFNKVLKEAGESTIIKTEGDIKENVLIHDLQRDPVKYNPIHVDFYVVEKGQKVNVEVPLNFIGVSEAVKSKGGNLVKVMHKIKVLADSDNIPHSIDVDISRLTDLDTNILVKDIVLPKGVELYHMHLDDVVASVVAQVEEDLSQAATGPDMSTIEVEKKGKKEEDIEE